MKRSVLTDGRGIPLGGANRHDSQLLEAALSSIPVERPDPTDPDGPAQHLCLDAAFDGDPVRKLVAAWG